MASSQKTEKSATEIENVADERKTVGILYWDNTDITWLKKNLKQEHVPYKRVPLPQQKDWESVVERSFCVILYHSQKSHRPITEMQMYIDYCNKTKDPNDMLIICDKDEDSIIHNSIKSLILTEAELDFCGYGKSNRETPERRFTDKVDQMQKVILKAQGSSSSGRTNAVTQTIGIFTRSDESEYSWLVFMLWTEQIQNIRPCYISNNNSQQFREDVSQCTFGILYHTKNRGRINVTDVTNSLYDEELRYLSKVLGREKVIVVIDDLEDSSDKTGTLKNQPSIQVLSQDQFLFSHEEKTSECISYCTSFLEGNKKEVDKKLKKIVDFIKIRGDVTAVIIGSAEKTHNVQRIRHELTPRIDNCQLDHGYTRILLQIFGSIESDRSSFIHSMKSAFTNDQQEEVLGSSVPLGGVITMVNNTETNYEGCKFYLHLGNVPLDGNVKFQESHKNTVDKIVRAKQNVKDLCVPIYIFREEEKSYFLKTIKNIFKSKKYAEENQNKIRKLAEYTEEITGFPPTFILNKTTPVDVGSVWNNKDVTEIYLETKPDAGPLQALEKEETLLNILKRVLDNVDMKLQSPLDREQEHNKLKVTLLEIMHEIFK